jgi:hypothetical protein
MNRLSNMNPSNDTATKSKHTRKGWFKEATAILQPIKDQKVALLHSIRLTSNLEALAQLNKDLKTINKESKQQCEAAKTNWNNKIGQIANNLSNNPKKAWSATYTVMDRVNGHHKKPVPVITQFRNENGDGPKDDNENIKTIKTHFTQVSHLERIHPSYFQTKK